MSIVDALHIDNKKKSNANLFMGVTVAVVSDINDPEQQGRVKVKLLNRDTSDHETGYIRVMTPMSGEQWGQFFMPQLEDEVLVAFSDGDINRGYVIGSLWNKNKKAPLKIENDKNDIRKIKTRAGHELIFHDEKDKEHIEIKSKKEFSIKLDDENEIILITDKAGENLVKIDSKNGQIEVTAKKKITLKTGKSTIILDSEKNSLNISSQSSISIKSEQININAKNTLDLKAGSALNAKCDGATAIKGATVKIN